MRKGIINIKGNDYSPILVGYAECCLNCDLKQRDCKFQCQDFEDSEDEYVALKRVMHEPPTTIWNKINKLFIPIESPEDLPF